MRLTRDLPTAVLIAGLGLAAPAFAQQASFDDTVLDAYVTAALAVSEVEQEYTAELAQATSEEERQDLIATANEQIVATIESTPGVDFDTYVEISQTAQADPELNQRIVTMAQERQAD
jgi:hypothetical protein